MFGQGRKDEEGARLLEDTEASPYAESTRIVTVNHPKHEMSRWLLISLLINAVLATMCIYVFTQREPSPRSPFPQHIYCKSQRIYIHNISYTLTNISTSTRRTGIQNRHLPQQLRQRHNYLPKSTIRRSRCCMGKFIQKYYIHSAYSTELTEF
jgi:hypothetical protein